MVAVTDTIENLEALRLEHDAFCEAIGRLPEKYRKAFVLRVVYQYSHTELAVYCGIPVNTVKGHIEKGLKLAQAYCEEGDNLWSH
jgi:DNA-directed RNA polymerase specialized sigma24 family protein